MNANRKPVATKPESQTALTNQERLSKFQEEIRSSRIYREVEAREGFIDQIYDLMEAQNVSRADLARRIGCTPAYITRILSGDVNFTIETLVKLCDAFDQELVLNCKSRLSRDESLSQENTAAIVVQPVTEPVDKAEETFEKRELQEVALKKRFQAFTAICQKDGALKPRITDPWPNWDKKSPVVSSGTYNSPDETTHQERQVA